MKNEAKHKKDVMHKTHIQHNNNNNVLYFGGAKVILMMEQMYIYNGSKVYL